MGRRDSHVLPPFLGADSLEAAGEVAVEPDVAEEDVGGAAGVEVHDVGQAEQDADEREVDALIRADGGVPGDAFLFELEAQPFDGPVVTDGDELEAAAEL